MSARELVSTGGWPEGYTFSPALRVGNLLFISGTTAGDRTGKIVAPGDIVGQTRYIYQKFARLLAAAGAAFEQPPYPTATGVIVAGLLREGALIEISAVAVLPG